MNERIRQVRLALKLSQEEFGERLGVGRGAITNIELDKVVPKPLFVSLLCREFNVNEEWLRTGEGEMFLSLAPETELARIFAEIQFSGDDTIRAIIRTYWGLSDGDKAVVRRIITTLADQIKKAPDDSPGP